MLPDLLSLGGFLLFLCSHCQEVFYFDDIRVATLTAIFVRGRFGFSHYGPLTESIFNEKTRIVKKPNISHYSPHISHTEQITFITRRVNTTDGKEDILEVF